MSIKDMQVAKENKKILDESKTEKIEVVCDKDCKDCFLYDGEEGWCILKYQFQHANLPNKGDTIKIEIIRK